MHRVEEAVTEGAVRVEEAVTEGAVSFKRHSNRAPLNLAPPVQQLYMPLELGARRGGHTSWAMAFVHDLGLRVEG